MDPVAEEPRSARMRPWRGPALLALVVVLGILPGAGYLQWRAPRVRADIQRRLAAAPVEPEGRLEHWLEFGDPQIQTRLTPLRLSSKEPWLVTHVVEPEGSEPEIWGLLLEGPRPARLERVGMRVEVHFPAPRLLAHGRLTGDHARQVPRFASRAAAGDPVRRARELVEWFLAKTIEALAGDIPGAELAIVVASPGA